MKKQTFWFGLIIVGSMLVSFSFMLYGFIAMDRGAPRMGTLYVVLGAVALLVTLLALFSNNNNNDDGSPPDPHKFA